jgi:hypothetical protein
MELLDTYAGGLERWLCQQFLNIKNVHFYMQRGFDDNQILIVRLC